MAIKGRRKSWRGILFSLLAMIGVWALSVSTAVETCPQCACSKLTVEHTSALNISTTEGGNASFSCRRNNNATFQDEWYIHTRDGRSPIVGSRLFREELTYLQYTLIEIPGEESLTYSLTLRNLSLLENGLLVTCESEHIGVCSIYPRRPFTLTVLPLAESEDCEEILEVCGNNLTACKDTRESLEMELEECQEEIEKSEKEIEEYKEEIEEYKEEIEEYKEEIETCEKAKNESLKREEELKANISLCAVARQESENDTRVCEENMTVVIAILLSSVIVNVALLIAVSVLYCKLRSRSKKFKGNTPTTITEELETSVKENVEAH